MLSVGQTVRKSIAFDRQLGTEVHCPVVSSQVTVPFPEGWNPSMHVYLITLGSTFSTRPLVILAGSSQSSAIDNRTDRD